MVWGLLPLLYGIAMCQIRS